MHSRIEAISLARSLEEDPPTIIMPIGNVCRLLGYAWARALPNDLRPGGLSHRMAERQDVVTEERMERYLDITARALAKIRVAAPDKSYNRRLADSFLEMANCYYADARHFKECGDYVTAFAAVNYAHAWLDCGARIGLFDVDGDDVLFTLYER